MPFTPYDAASHALGRAEAMLAAGVRLGARRRRQNRAGRTVLASTVPAPLAQDMYRQALVMAVAALDTYMHRLVVARVYEHIQLPSVLAGLTVPFGDLLEQADATGRAAREPQHSPRPRVRVKRQLRDRLLRETFQSHAGVSKALAMAGVADPWKAVAAALYMTRDDVKARLDGIVKQRNQIVHEGAYARMEKPRNAKMEPISAAQVQADIAFVRSVIDAIHARI